MPVARVLLVEIVMENVTIRPAVLSEEQEQNIIEKWCREIGKNFFSAHIFSKVSLENLGLEEGGYALLRAREFLLKFGCIAYVRSSHSGINNQGSNVLTERGREIASFPLPFPYACMLHAAIKNGCVEQILTVIAFLLLPNVFIRPQGKESEADCAHRQFKLSKISDVANLLEVWNRIKVWVSLSRSPVLDQKRMESELRDFCFKSFLHSGRMLQAVRIRRTLVKMMDTKGYYLLSSSVDPHLIDKTVATGLLFNLAEHQDRFEYFLMAHPALNKFATLSRSSAVKTDRFLVANSVEHGKWRNEDSYLRECVVVDAKWLPEIFPWQYTRGLEKLIEKMGQSLYVAQEGVYYHSGQLIEERKFPVVLKNALLIQNACKEVAKKESWQLYFFQKTYDGIGVWSSDGKRKSLFVAKVSQEERTKFVSGFYYAKLEDEGGVNYAIPQFQYFKDLELTAPSRLALAVK